VALPLRALWPAVVFVVVLVVGVWALLGYLAFRSGVKEANERLDSRAYAALTAQDGLVLTNPSTILVLGTDEGPGGKVSGARPTRLPAGADCDRQQRPARLAVPVWCKPA